MVPVAASVSSRRALLRAGSVGTGTALLTALPATAEAARGPKKKRSARRRKARKRTASSAATLHALSRFSYGWTPDLAREVTKARSFERWFDRQVTGGYPDTFYETSATWWPSVNAAPEEIWARDKAGVESMWDADANYQRWVLARRIHSRRQVLEVMTELWENHLHVPARGEGAALFRAAYGKAVRSHALGKYAELLRVAVTHPAMGVHLDNAVSTKRAPNENLGRELLELFTLGAGHYSEADVRDSARILTGLRVDTWKTWRVWYDPESHATGPVSVAGFTHANGSADGQPVLRAYLDHLARHPQTARTVARRIAVRFVSDEPSERLVAKLARVYLDSDTAVVPVLRALIADQEFAASRGAKVRTAPDDLVATYRALRVQLRRPTGPEAAANAILWQAGDLGTYPFAWPRPDGLPDHAAAWSSTSRFLASLRVHLNLAGGWWPKQDVKHRPHRAWVPLSRKRRSIRFDELVDHLSEELLGRSAPRSLVRAACQATGLKQRTRIDKDHALVKWQMPHLLTVFLDSPFHLTR